MPHKVIMKSIYGSHLYGTSTPTSDMDYKQIHMNPTDLILIGKDRGVFNQNTNNSGRNTKDDVDFESKELRTFIIDALQGQSYTSDLLYTPDNLILERSPLWDEIISLRHKLVTRNVKPIIGYINSMSAKYSNKGNKYNELKEFISFVEKIDIKMTIKESIHVLGDLSRFKYFKYEYKQLNKEHGENYLFAPDSSFPSTRQWDEVLPVLKIKFETFGKRVEEAAENNGLDLKAYYHALRLCRQLEDYLINGSLIFPSPRVQDLIDIRAGKYSREYIEEWISSEIDRVLRIPNELPEPDYEFWNNWLLDKYMQQAYEQSGKYLETRGLKPNLLQ